jgi:hypothetical protein
LIEKKKPRLTGLFHLIREKPCPHGRTFSFDPGKALPARQDFFI